MCGRRQGVEGVLEMALRVDLRIVEMALREVEMDRQIRHRIHLNSKPEYIGQINLRTREMMDLPWGRQIYLRAEGTTPSDEQQLDDVPIEDVR